MTDKLIDKARELAGELGRDMRGTHARSMLALIARLEAAEKVATEAEWFRDNCMYSGLAPVMDALEAWRAIRDAKEGT